MGAWPSALRHERPVANRIITMSAFHSEAAIARQISHVRNCQTLPKSRVECGSAPSRGVDIERRRFQEITHSDLSPLIAFSSCSVRNCQSAFKFDPASASNFDPFERRVLTVALGSSELAGVAETRRARAA